MSHIDFKVKAFWNDGTFDIAEVRVSKESKVNPRFAALDHASNKLFKTDARGVCCNPLVVCIIDEDKKK